MGTVPLVVVHLSNKAPLSLVGLIKPKRESSCWQEVAVYPLSHDILPGSSLPIPEGSLIYWGVEKPLLCCSLRVREYSCSHSKYLSITTYVPDSELHAKNTCRGSSTGFAWVMLRIQRAEGSRCVSTLVKPADAQDTLLLLGPDRYQLVASNL